MKTFVYQHQGKLYCFTEEYEESEDFVLSDIFESDSTSLPVTKANPLDPLKPIQMREVFLDNTTKSYRIRIE